MLQANMLQTNTVSVQEMTARLAEVPGYQICTNCIMDTSDPEIRFDDNGVCSWCRLFEERVKKDVFLDQAGQEKLQRLIERIKAEGRGKEYDCIIGVSGGVDSTYVAHLVKKKFGLRPLAVHLDNGWDAELAVSNVEKALKTLGIDLYTYVINWEEFKDLQLSFLKASVHNCEIPTDHAITATLFRIAAEKGIHYIISGSNVATEGILPSSWGYDHRDWKHIKAIHKRFGNSVLQTYPHYSLLQMFYYVFIKGIKFVPILNFVPYVKKQAVATLEQELGWRNYGGKHYESIYTRFFQAYILPRKFHVDKRRAHLSTLINSRQVTREQALADIALAPCTPEMLREDREYVIKKFGLTEESFEAIMNSPPKNFADYPSNHWFFKNFRYVRRFFRKFAMNS